MKSMLGFPCYASLYTLSLLNIFWRFLSLQPIELWTGKQLFSVLVRPNAHTKVFLNLTVKEKNYSKKKEKNVGEEEESMCGRETMCPNDGYVYFRNSELLSGQVGKATLGKYCNSKMRISMPDYMLLAVVDCIYYNVDIHVNANFQLSQFVVFSFYTSFFTGILAI